MAQVIEIEGTEAIDRCYPVMQQLRTHLDKEEFFRRVVAQMAEGYRLAAVEADGAIVAVAGWRIIHNLAFKSILYVDDLVTDEGQRSKGHGHLLLDWLRQKAQERDCTQLHLDSGTHRPDAHRFYRREGMLEQSLHFDIDTQA